jgi:SAM-dependent methyltransferase
VRPEVARRLVALNQDFYRRFAGPFAHSRATPQPGFARLLSYLLQPCQRFLDVGCGDGRLGRFLRQHGWAGSYIGLDYSAELLAAASRATAGDFVVGDISQPGALNGLGFFDAIACLATLQHVPGRANRVRLLEELTGHLEPDARLWLSNWQFVGSARMARKVVPWSELGLEPGDVEAGDYLLSWKRGGYGLRYAAFIDLAETQYLAEQAGLQLLGHFLSDGREDNLSLYTILIKGDSSGAGFDTPAGDGYNAPG